MTDGHLDTMFVLTCGGTWWNQSQSTSRFLSAYGARRMPNRSRRSRWSIFPVGSDHTLPRFQTSLPTSASRQVTGGDVRRCSRPKFLRTYAFSHPVSRFPPRPTPPDVGGGREPGIREHGDRTINQTVVPSLLTEPTPASIPDYPHVQLAKGLALPGMTGRSNLARAVYPSSRC